MKMMRYDPDRQPDAEAWLAVDESERLDLVMDYHRRAAVRLENAKVHAVAHVVVENQVLLGEETPVAATLDRLMQEGLNRHDAIHAIGGAFIEIVHDAIRTPAELTSTEPFFAGWRSCTPIVQDTVERANIVKAMAGGLGIAMRQTF